MTGVYTRNAAGEALPPMYIYDSSAKSAANFQVKTKWFDGLPTVVGKYWHHNLVENSFVFCSQGYGLNGRQFTQYILNAYIEQIVIPLDMHRTAQFDEKTGRLIQGPVILKLDAGPGRMVATEESVAAKEKLCECGLLLLFGLPNATAVN